VDGIRLKKEIFSPVFLFLVIYETAYDLRLSARLKALHDGYVPVKLKLKHSSGHTPGI